MKRNEGLTHEFSQICSTPVNVRTGAFTLQHGWNWGGKTCVGLCFDAWTILWLGGGLDPGLLRKVTSKRWNFFSVNDRSLWSWASRLSSWWPDAAKVFWPPGLRWPVLVVIFSSSLVTVRLEKFCSVVLSLPGARSHRARRIDVSTSEFLFAIPKQSATRNATCSVWPGPLDLRPTPGSLSLSSAINSDPNIRDPDDSAHVCTRGGSAYCSLHSE